MTSSNIKRIRSGSPWEDLVGYSRAIRKGNMIWVAGTTSIVDGKTYGKGDAYLQTKQCLTIIQKAVEDAGGQLEDVVRTRIFVTNIDDWEEIGKAHAEFFSEIQPAATMVEITRLISPDLLVEIEADACL